MRLIVIVLLFFAFINLDAQTINSSDIIGKWTVKNVTLMEIDGMQLDNGQQQKMDSIVKGFMNSIFTFNSDSTFQVTFSENMPEIMKELEVVNNKKWKYCMEKGTILIGTEKDDYSLLGFDIQLRAGKALFIIQESPFIIEVYKK
jgi:hypothetical protein